MVKRGRTQRPDFARIDRGSDSNRPEPDPPSGHRLARLEVTPAGEVVWEYVNPYFGPAAAAPGRQTNNVFRIYRYTEDEVARARKVIG